MPLEGAWGASDLSRRPRDDHRRADLGSAVGDDLPTQVGEDLFFGGSPARRWSPSEGLTAVGPPVPPNSTTFLLDDGTLVLVTTKPDKPHCRLVVRVAETDDSRWSAPLPNPDPFVPAGSPCRPVGQYDGAQVSLYFPSDGPMWSPAVVERSGGEWTVSPRHEIEQ